MGKCLMAVFVRVFAQKVTANICPIELLVERSRYATEKQKPKHQQ